MPLAHLCFVLPPTDADEDVEPPSMADRASKRPQTSSTRRRIGSLLRCSLRCLCNSRRWQSPCQCFSSKPSIHHQDPCHFHDAPGIPQVLDEKVAGGSTNPRIFSYAELYIGTNGFSEKEVLGSGGFGRVYRAVLPSDGTLAAVKCVAESGDRFEKSFAAELVAVAQLRHRNLVRLRGWCVHDDQLLLVYDYMPNHSLDRLLFAPAAASSSPPLPWEWRQRVVSGLAAALYYLHEQLDTQIIHRDVKTSNVMLDSGYNARLGDFGLARWLEHSQLGMSLRSSASVNESSFQFRLSDTSRIGGTIGYLPPESFQRKGSATAKSDVFSFGIVVLEVATGRRAVDLAYPDDQIILLDWVRRLSDEGKWLNAGDRKLQEGSYPQSDMRRLIHLGLLCSLHNPQSRPTMKWVTEALSGAGDLPALPSFQLHPLYISLSSSSSTSTSSTTRTATFASSDFLTATGSTVFLTADNGGSAGDSNNRRPSFKSFPIVDTPREIPYGEIVAITNNFDEAKMVAELDFGTGYRGYLDNRIHVLVKRLGMKTCPALRARFSDELLNLGRLRHRNLVQLRGWCTERGEMLVVYDYSSSGLLSHHLFHHRNSVLAWHHRYGIVKALASAVLYLHEEWDEQVIHRNITSSAVFLDPDMNPRLGSFALAEFLSRNEHGHHVASLKSSSSARGIFGYMSPEYMESGDAKTTTDVYSFGVVMLEVASGLMAVDLRWPEVLLVDRVHRFEESMRPLEELADRRLDGSYDRRELVRVVELGIACTRSDPESRPSMRQIVSILDGNDELLKVLVSKRGGRGGWEGKNASSSSSLYLIGRRMKALGIQ
ncbi:receptor like protein kinase S.2 [Iris pallida]|uniref:Receptor like protein kinase S.2 n=1 Tax=Iris pallida TaxID=29817 RepID=A0AAX6FCM7_IRIPA|nr:receptor like protein kinase S.2 [Iris pallida]